MSIRERVLASVDRDRVERTTKDVSSPRYLDSHHFAAPYLRRKPLWFPLKPLNLVLDFVSACASNGQLKDDVEALTAERPGGPLIGLIERTERGEMGAIINYAGPRVARDVAGTLA